MQMSVPERKSNRNRPHRVPWLVTWTLILGVAFFVATVVGGSVLSGLISLVLFVAFAALLYFGSGNETIAGLADHRRDERLAMINERSLAFAGSVMILILITGWIVELVNGHDGSPYSEVMGGGVIAYFAAALWLRFRS